MTFTDSRIKIEDIFGGICLYLHRQKKRKERTHIRRLTPVQEVATGTAEGWTRKVEGRF